MKVIYYSYKSTFAAYMAACLHIGVYNPDKIPDKDIIKAHYDLCQKYSEVYGFLFFIGIDQNLNEVYCTGNRRYYSLVSRMLYNLQKIFGIDEVLYYVNAGRFDKTLPFYIMNVFRILSLEHMSEWIFNMWFKGAYKGCVKLIKGVKTRINMMDEYL